MSELIPLATLNDVETYLKHKVSAELVEYTERKLSATSNVLRMLYRLEGDNLDDLITTDNLVKTLVNDTVATTVAIDVKKEEAKLGDDVDLSAFSQFTQSAAGYSFSGTWQGNAEDVFFTTNQLNNLGLRLPTISTFSFGQQDSPYTVTPRNGAPAW